MIFAWHGIAYRNMLDIPSAPSGGVLAFSIVGGVLLVGFLMTLVWR